MDEEGIIIPTAGETEVQKREVICPRIEVEEVVEVKVGKGLVIS